MLPRLADSYSLLSLLLSFMLSSLPYPFAQPLHSIGPFCLGSVIEYSIRSVCWSSKLPCVKSIPLAPGGVVISLKMKLPLVSSPYSSTSLFSGRLRPCSCEALWWKPIRQILEECSGGVVIPSCQTAPQSSYKYISHAGLEVSLNYIIFPAWCECSGGRCIVPYGRKLHQVLLKKKKMLR